MWSSYPGISNEADVLRCHVLKWWRRVLYSSSSRYSRLSSAAYYFLALLELHAKNIGALDGYYET